MKKATSLLVSAALIGTLSTAALAPAAFADERGGYGKRGEHSDSMRRGGPGRGGFIRLMCSEDGAARLEQILDRGGDRITLTDEQQSLYDDFKSQALAAQTQYADACVKPSRDAGTDIVDRVKDGQTNMKALVTAMDTVIPAFEAFHDSLTDEQKAELKPQRGKFRRGGDDRRDGMRRGPGGNR